MDRPDPAPDPEVIADLQLRARTERERRDTEGADYAWSRPRIVARWACRGGCGATVEVPEEAVQGLASMNAKLARRGEPPVGTGEVLFCAACKNSGRDKRAAAHRQREGEIAQLIRDYKSLVDNDLRERTILARLRELGHPDVKGLVDSVRASRAAKAARGSTRREKL